MTSTRRIKDYIKKLKEGLETAYKLISNIFQKKESIFREIEMRGVEDKSNLTYEFYKSKIKELEKIISREELPLYSRLLIKTKNFKDAYSTIKKKTKNKELLKYIKMIYNLCENSERILQEAISNCEKSLMDIGKLKKHTWFFGTHNADTIFDNIKYYHYETSEIIRELKDSNRVLLELEQKLFAEYYKSTDTEYWPNQPAPPFTPGMIGI